MGIKPLITNSLVAHIVGHQGQGLEQAHNLSGAWLAAFTVGLAGDDGCWFVTIRSTDQQIGEALVVFGKHIAKWHVHILQKQHSGNAVPAVAPPAPSQDPTSSTPLPSTQQPQPPSLPTLSTTVAPSVIVTHAAATPSTQGMPTPQAVDSPMATRTLTSVMPTPLAPGSPMDTSLPMSLSTVAPDMSTPIISYAFVHYSYSQSTPALCGTPMAHYSCP
ncbi:hypothetical protein C0989_004134 [Termitomyces sp. Mn162]|nr:hypothetical protein C0989_004134 [Termitomyces sp. Mn162]